MAPLPSVPRVHRLVLVLVGHERTHCPDTDRGVVQGAPAARGEGYPLPTRRLPGPREREYREHREGFRGGRRQVHARGYKRLNPGWNRVMYNRPPRLRMGVKSLQEVI